MADENTQRDQYSGSPVQVYERDDVIVGQPQARPAEPHDGSTRVSEVVVHTDRHILDPNHPLAVQVPEGVGASTVGYKVQLAEALRAGTAEEQFARAAKEAEGERTQASDKVGSPQASSEDKVDVQSEEHEGDQQSGDKS